MHLLRIKLTINVQLILATLEDVLWILFLSATFVVGNILQQHSFGAIALSFTRVLHSNNNLLNL